MGAPRKSVATPGSEHRRSRRIASQEPEQSSHHDFDLALQERQLELQQRIEALESSNNQLIAERDAAIKRARQNNRLQVVSTTRRIQKEIEENRKKAAEDMAAHKSSPSDTTEKLSTPKPATRRDSTTFPRTSPSPSRQTSEQKTPKRDSDAVDTEAATAQASALPSWKRLVSSVSGYLSPWARRSTPLPRFATPVAGQKRAVDDDEAESTPLAKKVRQGPHKNDRRSDEDGEPIGNRSSRAQSPLVNDSIRVLEETSEGHEAASQTPRNTNSESVSRKRRMPAHFSTMPRQSSREASTFSAHPGSLSTIDEWEAPPDRGFASVTPSRPRQRRSTIQVRAARTAGLSTPKPTRAPQRVPLSADRRLEKMRHYSSLQRELEELAKDEDVVEMQQHRRKRVKVDDLLEIPHNLPGDAEGTFRFPDVDSDSEIEVDENVPLKTNVFGRQEQASQAVNGSHKSRPSLSGNALTEKMSDDKPKVSALFAATKPVSAVNIPATSFSPITKDFALPSSSPNLFAQASAKAKESSGEAVKWSFPCVGPRTESSSPADVVMQSQKAFAEGFTKWLETSRMVSV